MKKILVAYDGGEPARRALDMAADLAEGFGAEVGVVSVIPYHPGRSPIDPWDDRSVHTAELAEAQTMLGARGITTILHEPAGDPAHAIEEVAESHGYDMVVVGSRGLGAIGRVMQGSVSEHIATHAAASVLITR